MMYKVNDLIMYGTEGVYKIESIGQPDTPYTDKGKLYYSLKPLHSDGRTYAPIDTKKFSRPIITPNEAHSLIDQIPSIETKTIGGSARAIEDSYRSSLNTHNCADLIQIIKTVREKNRIASSRGKNLCQVDLRYKKKAEDLLFGELSAALDIPRADVEGYIDERIRVLDTE